ncbi:hypothetical protein ACLOJK_015444 [Asimina triloba]
MAKMEKKNTPRVSKSTKALKADLLARTAVSRLGSLLLLQPPGNVNAAANLTVAVSDGIGDDLNHLKRQDERTGTRSLTNQKQMKSIPHVHHLHWNF